VASSGGAVAVLAAATTTGTVVSSGGQELVSSGGVASGTTVLSGGAGYVYSGGVASGTAVSNDARETISAGGEIRGLAVAAGGVLVDDGQALISGAGTLAGTLTGSGLIAQTQAGDLVLSGSDAGFGGGALIEAGTIELATSGALGSGYAQFVEPTTGSAVLQIDAADAPAAGGTFASTIFDFSGANEDIDLRSIAYVSGASATLSGSTLVLTDGGATYKFNLAGTTAGAYPVLSDGHGGTLIDPTAAAPKALDPKVLAFAHAAAAFAPSDAANAALASSTSPIAQTSFLHATTSVGAGRP
jgi:autotransporter passenger strand-loop-strand repeat protein